MITIIQKQQTFLSASVLSQNFSSVNVYLLRLISGISVVQWYSNKNSKRLNLVFFAI